MYDSNSLRYDPGTARKREGSSKLYVCVMMIIFSVCSRAVPRVI